MSWFFCWLALTLNIYTEAGGEGYKGMHMVADTVVTRSFNKDFPDEISQVVLQKNQFSWTRRLKSKDLKGLMRYQSQLMNSSKFTEKERRAFSQAGIIAFKAIQPNYKPKYHYLYFYSGTDKPKWASGHKSIKYKGHYFIRKL